MRDRKRKTAFFDLSFSIRRKKQSYAIKFDDFRAAFFDLPFSIATTYRNGGDFRSEKMAIEKYCAARYQGVFMAHFQKPRENTRAQRLKPQRHTKALEGMIIDSGVDNTAFDMHSSVAVATTDGCMLYNIVASCSSCCSLGYFQYRARTFNQQHNRDYLTARFYSTVQPLYCCRHVNQPVYCSRSMEYSSSNMPT